MSQTEKLICGDCKAVFDVEVGKRGSAFIETLLWSTLFFPGIFYHYWRNIKPKKNCDYCGSNFLLPIASPLGFKMFTEKNNSLRKKI